MEIITIIWNKNIKIISKEISLINLPKKKDIGIKIKLETTNWNNSWISGDVFLREDIYTSITIAAHNKLAKRAKMSPIKLMFCSYVLIDRAMNIPETDRNNPATFNIVNFSPGIK